MPGASARTTPAAVLACRAVPVIFSGIQPTGTKHLGNYIGAIRQYVEGQDRGDPAIYCVVGALNRMHQFRDKSVAQRELVSAGLLFYPVLQAADVLAYRAHEVPVGEDQREHLELMRDVARRFNARYGEDVLVVPEHRIPEVGARIMDLQEPSRKMSTTGGSEEGTVYVLDEPKAIEKKLKRAVTDSGTEIVRHEDKPGVSNLIDILAVARGVSPEAGEDDMRSARGYGDLKCAVAEAVVAMLAPVRERYEDIRPDQDRLEAILAQGAEKARAIASD